MSSANQYRYSSAISSTGKCSRFQFMFDFLLFVSRLVVLFILHIARLMEIAFSCIVLYLQHRTAHERHFALELTACVSVCLCVARRKIERCQKYCSPEMLSPYKNNRLLSRQLAHPMHIVSVCLYLLVFK